MSFCKVYYEKWQMECCGTPFAVGDTVDWLVGTPPERWLGLPADMREYMENITYCYDAHNSDWEHLFHLTGTVTGIEGIYYRYRLVKSTKNFYRPVKSRIRKLTAVSGAPAKLDEKKLAVYGVCIDHVTVRPARKEEVTYR